MQTGDFSTAAELLKTTANFDNVKIKAGLDIKMYQENLKEVEAKFPFYKKDNQENFYAIQPLDDQLNLFMLVFTIGLIFIIRDHL